MSRAVHLLLLVGLFIGMMSGAMAHAAESAGAHDVPATIAWMHSDADHDQVPADSDKDYPHHHTICHGHDLAAPMKSGDAPLACGGAMVSLPRADRIGVASAPGSLLRPPIA